ncbi:hypothetical protein [[Mycoplasma] imitans]|uniref:hypothetical protein n=1 Tax=[Mycoplasma] imitans TaxID=29560 RepID=UPI0004810F06|nr:hypothetical protein [[Mycoplasma] imitans]
MEKKKLLASFNTLDASNTNSNKNGYTVDIQKSALTLVKGLNKVVVTGLSELDNGNAPYLGDLQFTLRKSYVSYFS